MKTNILRTRLALAAGLSVVALFGVIAGDKVLTRTSYAGRSRAEGVAV